MPGQDPLGKRALFWMPADQATPTQQSESLGKRALYSGPQPSAAIPSAGGDQTVVGTNPIGGPITVTCPTCEVTSRIGVLDFLIYQLPVGFWLPLLGHRMTCPSCRRRVWASVTLR